MKTTGLDLARQIEIFRVRQSALYDVNFIKNIELLHTRYALKMYN